MHLSEEHKKKLSSVMKGRNISPSTEFKKGHTTNVGKIGVKRSKKGRENMSIAAKGKPKSIEHRNKIIKNLVSYNSGNIGNKNSSWKGGITLLQGKIRRLPEYSIWRKAIFERDNYTCQQCFKKGGDLEAHHNIETFAKLLIEFLNQYNQFSPYEDKEILVRLAITYKPFWDINNGITYCKVCHRVLSYSGVN